MNGWVAYVQTSTLHIASPDGSATVDDLSIGDVSCPTFAPVGSLLAYRQDGNLVFAAIGERGTIEAQLAVHTPWRTEGCPVWSPDGRAVAESVRGESSAPTGTVGVVSIDGSLRRVQLPGRGWTQWIAWSFDGSSVLATRGAGDRTEVVMVPLDGEEPIVVHETTAGAGYVWEYYAALQSSPAGPYFAVIVRSCDGVASPAGEATACLRVVGFDGNVVFEEEGLEGSWTLHWAPDGQRLAWFGREGIRVRSIDAAESHAIPLEGQVEGADGQVEGCDAGQGLIWSPDGARLLCEVSYTGERHEHAIVSVAADGSGDVIVHSGWQGETPLLRQGDLTWQRR